MDIREFKTRIFQKELKKLFDDKQKELGASASKIDIAKAIAQDFSIPDYPALYRQLYPSKLKQ